MMYSVFIGEQVAYQGTDFQQAKAIWLSAAADPANDKTCIRLCKDGRELARFGLFVGSREAQQESQVQP